MSKVFCQYWSVQRTDGLNIQSCCFFQQILHLHTVFAHNADIIPARLARPVLVHIQRAEFAEAMRGISANLVRR